MLKKIIFFLMLLLLTACTQRQNEAMLNKGEKPTYVSNKPAGRDQEIVKNDITDQNPNFLNLNKTGPDLNQGDDVEKARQVVNSSKEFKADSVWINGEDMWVTVYKKGILSDREKVDAEATIHKALVKALPRYNIEVKVQEDRS